MYQNSDPGALFSRNIPLVTYAHKIRPPSFRTLSKDLLSCHFNGGQYLKSVEHSHECILFITLSYILYVINNSFPFWLHSMLYIEKIVQFNYPNVATTTETFQKHCILKFFLYISIFSSFIGVLQSSTESKRNVASDV